MKGSKEFEKGSPGIRVLCPTRWTVKADTLQSIVDNYEVLFDVWEESMDYVHDVEMRGRIRGVASYMTNFDLLLSMSRASGPHTGIVGQRAH